MKTSSLIIVLFFLFTASSFAQDDLYDKLIKQDRDIESQKKQISDLKEDIEIKNSAVYYVTNEKNLIKCLNTIKLSKEIDYSKYISSNDYKKNISNTFYKLF